MAGRIASLALAALILAPDLLWAAEPPAVLRLGVVGAGVGRVSGLPATDRLEPFRRRLAAVVQKPVSVNPQPDGRALVAALVAGRVDYAILSASAFAAAERTCTCLEPLAVPRAADGATGWRASIVVRGEAAVRDAAGLKGQTLAAPPADSFAGRAYALAALAKAGVKETDFARIDTLAGASEALAALIDRRADAALIWLPAAGTARGTGRGPLAVIAERRALPPEGLRTVWESPPVPHGPHVVRADLPVEWSVRLRETLLHLKADDPDAYDAVEPELDGGFAAIDKAAFDDLAAALPAR